LEAEIKTAREQLKTATARCESSVSRIRQLVEDVNQLNEKDKELTTALESSKRGFMFVYLIFSFFFFVLESFALIFPKVNASLVAELVAIKNRIAEQPLPDSVSTLSPLAAPVSQLLPQGSCAPTQSASLVANELCSEPIAALASAGATTPLPSEHISPDAPGGTPILHPSEQIAPHVPGLAATLLPTARSLSNKLPYTEGDETDATAPVHELSQITDTPLGQESAVSSAMAVSSSSSSSYFASSSSPSASSSPTSAKSTMPLVDALCFFYINHYCLQVLCTGSIYIYIDHCYLQVLCTGSVYIDHLCLFSILVVYI
jgi:hypothetical protein